MPKSNPKVTVTMPAYNASKYINEAIKSVLTQDYNSFELLILDDGSTDNTWDIIRQYRKDPCVRIYRNKKNSGVAKTRNKLVKLAKGKYISICDADDLMLLGNLKTLSKFLDTHPKIGVVYGNMLILNINNKNELTKRPYVAKTDYVAKWDLLERNSIVSHPGAMIRKEAISRAGGYDEALFYLDDLSLWLKLFEVTKFEYLKDGLYYIWRRHPQSLTRVVGPELKFVDRDRIKELAIDEERIKIKEEAIKRRYGFDFKFR